MLESHKTQWTAALARHLSCQPVHCTRRPASQRTPSSMHQLELAHDEREKQQAEWREPTQKHQDIRDYTLFYFIQYIVQYVKLLSSSAAWTQSIKQAPMNIIKIQFGSSIFRIFLKETTLLTNTAMDEAPPPPPVVVNIEGSQNAHMALQCKQLRKQDKREVLVFAETQMCT